ncbi:unnamed protein product [Trichogramma brassicae]|uniref:Catalase n=1 Tax=Trichogramma brassicae TaxID=86971 RepID=A0A6H5ISQ8_9HYME|nr:unnamed protein product [Trichogramma brassicae]
MPRDPAAEQLNEYKKRTKPGALVLTGNGVPIANKQSSLTVGPRGPILLQDFVLIDETSHFDRERIPERVIHAKGAGAFGYFEVTHDITKYTRAKLFSKIGKKTPLVARFSQVSGESGSADTSRDPRGFAIKFYTEEGVWDMVGNNTPIFFVKDPLMFPSFIHTQKRNPATHLKDADMFWDFLTLRPESTHQVLILFSDRGIPDGYRFMHGYGSHTFKLVNEQKETIWCKFHFKTDQGIKNFEPDKAKQIGANDPDYSIRDLYNAIATGKYPSWTFYIQVMTQKQAESFRWNPFDVTKVWPHKEYPLMPVGKLTLNKNPDNYFSDPSPDKLLQGRLFSYGDTHRHRLGPNYQQLPVNCPYKLQRAAGSARPCDRRAFTRAARPIVTIPSTRTITAKRHCSGAVLDDGAKSRLVRNIADHLKNASAFIQERALRSFGKVDVELGKRLTEALRKSDAKIHAAGISANL